MSQSPPSASEKVGRAIGILLLLASPVLIWLLIRALVPPTTPRFQDPSFIEAVFASRFVIATVRFAILFAALYVVVSVVALIARGQWLSSVGPFRVSESVRALKADRDQLARALREAVDTIESLQDELAQAERELRSERRAQRGDDH